MDCDVGNVLLKEIKDCLIEQNKLLAEIKSSNVQTQDPANCAYANSQTSELPLGQTPPVTTQESMEARLNNQGQGDTDVQELKRSCPSE